MSEQSGLEKQMASRGEYTNYRPTEAFQNFMSEWGNKLGKLVEAKTNTEELYRAVSEQKGN